MTEEYIEIDEQVELNQKCKKCGTTEDVVPSLGFCGSCVAVFSERHAQKKTKKPSADLNVDHNAWLLQGTLSSTVASGNGVNRVIVAKELTDIAKPHQKEGVEFIWKKCFSDLVGGDATQVGGCILAHFMGLGKSFTTITLLHSVMTCPALVSATTRKPLFHKVLLVVPTNTLTNWENEIFKWTGSLKNPLKVHNLGKFHSSHRLGEVQKWKIEGGVLIVGDALFQRMCDDIVKKAQPDILVLDEAHKGLKSPATQIFKKLQCIRTKRKVLLTGTPLQNNVTEYYHMIEFAVPGALDVKSVAEFEKVYRKPIERGLPSDASAGDRLEAMEKQRQLKRKLDTYVSRKSAKVLRNDLPAFSDTIIFLQQSPVQSRIMKFHKRCQQNSHKSNNFFRAYADLAPVLNHPGCLKIAEGGHGEKIKWNLTGRDEDPWLSQLKPSEYEKLQSAKNSPKFIVLAHILAIGFKSGEKTLIFSKCLKTLDLLECFLSSPDWKRQISSLKDDFADKLGGMKKNRDYLRIDGSVHSGTRGSLVDDFNNDDQNKIKIFLISSEAGGLGINLCGASQVVIFDNHFNPAVTDQCVARAHRYGQSKPVRCFRFAIEGCVEEKIYKRSENKAAVASRVIDGLNSELQFSHDELDDLQKNDVYATCKICLKKRWLQDGQDPPGEDDSWECKSNIDPKHNRCDIPEEKKVLQALRDREEQQAKEKDPILRHLLGVVNFATRQSPIVTRYFPVEAARTDTSCDDAIEKLKNEIAAKYE